MRWDIRNWGDLVDAVDAMRKLPLEEPRVIVLFDPGGITYHFVLARHGLAKLSSDRRGEPYPELSQAHDTYKPRQE